MIRTLDLTCSTLSRPAPPRRATSASTSSVSMSRWYCAGARRPRPARTHPPGDVPHARVLVTLIPRLSPERFRRELSSVRLPLEQARRWQWPQPDFDACAERTDDEPHGALVRFRRAPEGGRRQPFPLENHSLISRSAESGPSEPWTRFSLVVVLGSPPRIEPGCASVTWVLPMRIRHSSHVLFVGTLDDHGEDGGAGEEGHEVTEEGHLAVLRVVLLGEGSVGGAQLGGGDPQALPLDPGHDLADQAAAPRRRAWPSRTSSSSWPGRYRRAQALWKPVAARSGHRGRGVSRADDVNGGTAGHGVGEEPTEG